MAVLIRQLLAGRDFALNDENAASMANFAYLLKDGATRHCALIDAAWDVTGLLEQVAALSGKLVAAIATHTHADHVGGDFAGLHIQGAAEVVRQAGVPLYVHALEAPRLVERGLSPSDLVPVHDGDTLALGETTLRFLHTPGHTPGAMCVLADNALFTGDTLFVGECGRVDLPGSSPQDMWQSLQRLAALPGERVVYPGHDYGPTPTSTIERERATNPNLLAEREAWLRSCR